MSIGGHEGHAGLADVRVYVHLDQGRAPNTWHEGYLESRWFDPSPYGYASVAADVRLSFSSDAREGRVGRAGRQALKKLVGFDLVHAWRNRDRARSSDVIWTHTEHEHLALCLLKAIGLLDGPRIVAQSVWLWDSWDGLGPVHRRFWRRLLREAAVHSTHSPVNAAVASGVLGTRALVVPFGVTPQQQLPLPRPGPSTIVVAPGNDRHRDWESLAEVARLAPDIDVRVFSRRRAARRHRRGRSNFSVESLRSTKDLVRHYREATVVVVPLRPNRHASGITVALEGLTHGRAVVITDTGGIRAYLGDHVEYADPGDAASLLAAVRRAAARKPGELADAHRHVHEAGLTLDDYARRHVLLTQALIAGTIGERPAEFETFRPVVPRP